VAAHTLAHSHNAEKILESFDALWARAGSPYKSFDGNAQGHRSSPAAATGRCSRPAVDSNMPSSSFARNVVGIATLTPPRTIPDRKHRYLSRRLCRA